MPTAAEYLTVLSKNARQEHDAWWLISERVGDERSRKAKLQATLEFFGQQAKFEQLSAAQEAYPARANLSPELDGLLEQLVADLADYVSPEQHGVYRQIHFGFLPVSSVDGFCVDRTLQGQKLEGFLVVINEGLWVCSQLLAKAFVLENLCGDLQAYNRSGLGDFEIAIRHYLAPSGKNANAVFFEGTPPEVEGALAAAQSSMAVLLLQFVVLHEVGHVVHGHFDLLGEYRFHLGESCPCVTSATEKHWAAELAADEYALEAISRHSSATISRWANFITIYVFFFWLAEVERVVGRPLCPLHPPPQQRASRLLDWMLSHYPPDEEIQAYFAQTEQILNSWTKGATA